MAKPRKQTYTIDLFLKNLKERDIRQDQDVQRLSDQWNNSMRNELLVTVLNDGYIPPIILGQEESSQMWVVDGLQRSTTLMAFRYGNYKITSAVEEPMITYRAKSRDSHGEVKLDGCGDIIWEDKQIDIRHKTYDRLPEELKKKFSEYQIETVIHENYDMTEISKLVRRYNFHKSMNASQKMFTYVDQYARKIREILRRPFFIECTGYTKTERKNGTLERILLESVMCMFHMDNWRKSIKIGEFINEQATKEQFDILDDLISRIEKIVTEKMYDLFTSKDSFLWFSLFYQFTQLGFADERFADFLSYFMDLTQEKDMDAFYGVEKYSSNKDKSVVMKKLNVLETMLYEFLGMIKIDRNEEWTSEILAFVQVQVDADITAEDIKQGAEILEALARKIGASTLWKDENMPSLIAMVIWSFLQDIDLDDWMLDYCRRKDSYIRDQEENFKSMCEDCHRFIKQAEVA